MNLVTTIPGVIRGDILPPPLSRQFLKIHAFLQFKKIGKLVVIIVFSVVLFGNIVCDQLNSGRRSLIPNIRYLIALIPLVTTGNFQM